VAELRALGMTVIGSVSLAVLPMTNLQRMRQVSLFGAAFASLFIALVGVLLHFARSV
jgi:TolB-like protein